MATQPARSEAEQVDPTDVRAVALRNIRQRREFGTHLLAYLSVNSAIVCIWLLIAAISGEWFPWPLFPILGWGIGLASHAWATFGPPPQPPNHRSTGQRRSSPADEFITTSE